MSEILTTDTYKMIYKDITPRDEFRQRMLNQGTETKIYRMKPRLSYVAMIFICLIVMVGGTTYAYTHPALVRKFFGNNVAQEDVEQLYSVIDQQIHCDGYIYTVEGNIYDKELGVGYLTIKIQDEDGSAPVVETGNHDVDKDLYGMIWPGSGLSRQWLKIDDQYVLFYLNANLSTVMNTVENNEEEVYFYWKYYTEYPEDTLELAIIGQKEYQEKFKSLCPSGEADDSLIRELDNSFPRIELTYQAAEYVKFSGGDIEAIVGNMDIEVTYNKNETNLKNLALIEADGNRIEIVSGGRIIWKSDVYTGGTEEWNDKGEYTLEYQFGKIIDPQTVLLEVNGIVYPIQ